MAISSNPIDQHSNPTTKKYARKVQIATQHNTSKLLPLWILAKSIWIKGEELQELDQEIELAENGGKEYDYFTTWENIWRWITSKRNKKIIKAKDTSSLYTLHTWSTNIIEDSKKDV